MKRIAAITLLISLVCTGCGIYSTEGTFASPELSKEHKELMAIADTVRGVNLEYASPRSGLNRQSVQLMDLDGDGTGEGIAFLRDATGTYKTSIYIFRKNLSGTFGTYAVLDGEESEVYSVSYADICGNPGSEIIVEWGAEALDERSVTVYNFGENGIEEILDVPESLYAVSPAGEDGRNKFITLTSERGRFFVNVYEPETGEKKSQMLPAKTEKVLRIRTGTASGADFGIYADGETKTGAVTDVILFSGGKLTEATPGGVFRNSKILCEDINSDGTLEIPVEEDGAVSVPSGNGCYIWNAVQAAGGLSQSAFTYHSFTENFYISMPLAWAGTIGVKRAVVRSGQTEISFFSAENAESGEKFEAPLFTVYILTGDMRSRYGQNYGRFKISENESTVFAASVTSESYLGTAIDESFIQSAFRFRENDWISDVLFA